jgi:hypothetical protein
MWTKPELSQPTTESNSHLFDGWFDPIETGIRDRVRGLIEEMICGELDAVLSRPHYGRRAVAADGSDVVPDVTGHRHGRRVRTLTGTFGKTEIAVPRARLNTAEGKTTEWKSQSIGCWGLRLPSLSARDNCDHSGSPAFLMASRYVVLSSGGRARMLDAARSKASRGGCLFGVARHQAALT